MTRHPDPCVTIESEDRGERGMVARIAVDYPTRLNALDTSMAGLFG